MCSLASFDFMDVSKAPEGWRRPRPGGHSVDPLFGIGPGESGETSLPLLGARKNIDARALIPCNGDT